jgi:hypothetical protein
MHSHNYIYFNTYDGTIFNAVNHGTITAIKTSVQLLYNISPSPDSIRIWTAYLATWKGGVYAVYLHPNLLVALLYAPIMAALTILRLWPLRLLVDTPTWMPR